MNLNFEPTEFQFNVLRCVALCEKLRVEKGAEKIDAAEIAQKYWDRYSAVLPGAPLPYVMYKKMLEVLSSLSPQFVSLSALRSNGDEIFCALVTLCLPGRSFLAGYDFAMAPTRPE